MKSPFFVLQALIFCNCFIGSYLQKLVWVSNFNTDESDSWNVTSGNGRFQRVLYSSILTPSQGDYWLISAQGVNKELMPPPVPYYGGKITVQFLAYVLQPSTLTVRFLRDNFNYEQVQASSISIASNGWSSYSVSLNIFQYPSFLVSFIYSSDIRIYLDAIKITIDGSIMSCPTVSSSTRCGFTLDVFSNYGWSFAGTKVDWITTSAFTYLKRDFLYLGGLLKGSMNFKAIQNGVSATIQISVNQTSYQQRINSGYTEFDLSASTQYTVGQTYTILITFITTSIRAQLSSLSMNVAGDMALCKCPALLTCTKLTNGVTCACNVDTCPGLNKQCIVSQFNQSADPCSCLPGYTEDSSGNCVGAVTTTSSPTTTMLTTSTTDTNNCKNSMLSCPMDHVVCKIENGRYLYMCEDGWKMDLISNRCVGYHKIPISVCTFESKEGCSGNKTSNYNPFQIASYSIIPIPPQEGDYCAFAQGNNCELLQSEVQYNGGTIIIDFYAYASQPSNLIVRLLMSNSNEVQSFSVSIKSNGWNLYSVSHDTFLDTSFLVSFIYSGNSTIYMDSISTSIGDINECTGLTPACSWSNGVCTNTNGSYQCTCASGWKMGQNNVSCVDINECISNPPPCSWRNGVCTNTNGGYFCSCLNEWKLGQDNTSCVDKCNNTCVYTYTNETYTSSCNNSFQLKSNLECFDVSECLSNNNCNWTNGVCTNAIGRFKCLCNGQWELNENGTNCIFPTKSFSPSDNFIIVGYIPFNKSVLIMSVVIYICKLPDNSASNNLTNCYPVGEFNPQSTNSFTVGSASSKLSRKKRDVLYDNNYNSTMPPCFWRACNTNGSYYCPCQDYPSCVDNPCDSLQPPCSWSHGICNKTNGSYLCTCEMGWMMGKNNASCVDNPCDSLQPPCSWSYGICNKTNSSYLCTCEKGWVIGEDNASCVDENECISKQPPCSWRNGVCRNTNGGYSCSCLNDWRLGQDNASCIDKCNNTCIFQYSFKNDEYTSVDKYNDTYSIPCINGSQLNTNLTKCFNVDECKSFNNCNWDFGVCTNSVGDFKCLCNDGWTLKSTKTSCTFSPRDVIPSSNSIKVKYIPFYSAVQINVTGGIKAVGIYVCKLSAFDVIEFVNLSHCLPVGEFNSDWFTIGSGKSSRKKRSVNYDNPPLEEGAVYVVFYIGFTSDGQSFTSPLSEPIVTVDPSSPCVPIACYSYKNQRCNVINSTYAKCHCKNGFISFDNGLTCEDIDECSSVANTCNFKNSQCTNLIGSFACSCMKGYKLNDTQGSCVDINECGTLCKAPNTTCNNTPGSYECLCNVSGSYYNTTMNACFDLNECSMSNQPCDPVRGICNNQNVFETGITYTCSCPIGYELSQDGSNSCLDINECSTLCKGRSALCINTIGSFKCSCAVGFSMNSSSQCQLNNLCNCPLNSSCTMNGSFDCTCNPGYSKNFMSNCQANDQCLSITNCMKPHQVCQNSFTNLSYTCLCRNGYEKIGDECKAIKVNVCNLSSMNNISLCPFDQQCYDTNSGFECRCLAGYVKNNIGYCQDVNECEENISACPSNAYCTNTNGSYYCQCNKGFIGENVSNSSIMHCYMSNSAWSSWEQIGTCSVLCAIDEKQGNLKFQRFCEAVNFSSCNDNYFKEEVCNSELCENKIEIFKSADCEKWSNMQANVSDHSLNSNETWINKIRAWGGWKAKACGPSLVGASKFVNEDIENITKEINSLLANRKALRKAVDCNAYIQRKNSLKTQYTNIYSRLAMYTAIKAALNKLKSRVDIKLNECTRGLSAIYF